MFSVIILAKNEEKNIQKALESVSFADEIVVADNSSQDKTAELARNKGAQVFTLKKGLDFSQKRNEALKQTAGEWILFLDADEVLTKELAEEIQTELKNPQFSAYYLKRRDFFWGKELKHGETKKVRKQGIVRLFRKNTGKWKGQVHEIFTTNLSLGRLKNFINHYPHPTVKNFLEKVNHYSTLRAQELFTTRKRTSILEIICLPLGKFILNYLIYFGFLDGPAGFTYAFMMSFHSFLVRGKLFELQNS